MPLELILFIVWATGMAINGLLYGMWARFEHRSDRERAWLAAVLWPVSIWVEIGFRLKPEWDRHWATNKDELLR